MKSFFHTARNGNHVGDSAGASFADCLDALVNKGFYLNLSLSMLFLSSTRSGQGQKDKDSQCK